MSDNEYLDRLSEASERAQAQREANIRSEWISGAPTPPPPPAPAAHRPPPPTAPAAGPLFETTSRVNGRSSIVTVWPDRVILRRKKTLGFGGHDEVTMPMRAINFVSKGKDGIHHHKVVLHTSGNTVEVRCPKDEADRLAHIVQQQILS